MICVCLDNRSRSASVLLLRGDNGYSPGSWSVWASFRRLEDYPSARHQSTSLSYRRRVFIAPPWKEIYEQDRERKQDFAEAVRTYEAMLAAYSGRGYEPIQIPPASVEQRARFVLQSIGIAG
ncbi:MAG: AAA family ATPase [Acidobacteriota bacterium]